MTRFHFSSLRARLLLLILLAIIPAVGLILYTAAEQQRQAAIEVMESALRLARIVSGDQERLIEGARQLLAGLAQLPAVWRHDAGACGALFAALLKRFPFYVNLVAAKPDGEIFCGGVPPIGPVNIADRAYFQRALETRDFIVGDYIIGRIIGKPILTLAYPSVDNSGIVRAVVVAGLDLGRLAQLVANAQLPRGSTCTVIDRTGTILARYPEPEKWVGRSARDAPIVGAMLTRHEGVIEGRDIDGIPRLFAFTALLGAREAGGAHVSIGIPKEVAFAGANRILARNLAGLGLVAVLTLAAAWFGGDLFVLRRMKLLMGAARRLAAGDLKARTGMAYGREELGELARAFDEMAESLEEREVQLRRAEADSQAAEARFAGTLDIAAEAIIVMDEGQRILLFNKGAERIFGCRAEEVLDQPLDLLIPARFVEAHRRHVGDFAAAPEAARLMGERREIVGLRRGGGEFPVEASISKLTQQGKTTFTCVLRDITERKRAEEEIRLQREALLQREKLATMGELLAGVAHELNNPLSVVTGQAALLRQIAGEGPVAVRAEKISHAAERCARIVRNFLALARQRPPQRQRTQLNRVIRESVELLGYPLRVDNVEVSFDLADDLPVLWADPHQLQQVVVNLVTNAHHAMRETPPPRRLTLTSRFDPGQGQVSLEVADTGPGIPPAIRDRIFEPFFTTKPPGQGTGLGLSLCQGIVESHGGTIGVESEAGQGALFRVELPAGDVPAFAAEDREGEDLPPIRDRAVLVVDDEPEVAGVLADLLSADGHQVETAADGTVALDKLGDRRYDLIISDVKMPVLDGPGLYREIERRHSRLVRRFIFVTGDTLGPETRKLIEQTGTLCVSKPFVLDEVRRVVQRALRLG